LIERATIEAYHDSFRLVSIAGLLLVPMVLLIRGRPRRKENSVSFESKRAAKPFEAIQMRTKKLYGKKDS
jgi:hypothetical protein